MSEGLHRLLTRQINNFYPELLTAENGKELVDSINKTYLQFEREQKILEESAKHMLVKIAESNENLHTIIESLDGFNYHVSHNLKNSMINTINLSRMLQKYIEQGNLNRISEIVKKLNETSLAGLNLVDNFLRVAQFESKLVDQDLTLVHIPELTAKVIYDLGFEGEFTLRFDQMDFETMKFKYIGMQSLLQNLITNAFKYKKENVPLHIEIKLIDEGSHKIISFKDNGIGIDLVKEKDKLFKPFVRISNHLNQEGTGVGLFLVKKVVVEHLGSIKVNSELDKGVEFLLKF
jgi:signal transduction histidine kinase